MKLNKLLPFLIFLGVFSNTIRAQKNFIDQAFIEVTGQYETEIIPDEIYLTIILNENDKKGKTGIEKQENQMIKALNDLDINTKDHLLIQDFDGSFKKYFLQTDKVTKIKRYQLIVDNGKLLGEVYRSLSKINISNISIEKISHSEIEKYRRETKINALKVAKEKAIEYALSIDQSIGKAIHIEEISSSNISNYLMGAANGIQVRGYSSEKQETISNLNLETIKLTATVQTKFILN